MITSSSISSHNVFTFDDNIIFSSNFDNGNLARVERVVSSSSSSSSSASSSIKYSDYRIWSACDNMGTPKQSKHCAWFYFAVSNVPVGNNTTPLLLLFLFFFIINLSPYHYYYYYYYHYCYCNNNNNNRSNVKITTSQCFQPFRSI